jgi:hypothetical protein
MTLEHPPVLYCILVQHHVFSFRNSADNRGAGPVNTTVRALVLPPRLSIAWYEQSEYFYVMKIITDSTFHLICSRAMHSASSGPVAECDL